MVQTATAYATGQVVGAVGPPSFPAYFQNNFTGLFSLTPTHSPGVPNPCAAWTVYSVRSGNWSDPGVWNTGVVPTGADRTVVSAGMVVTVDTPSAASLGLLVGGTLAFSPAVTTGLTVAQFLVAPSGTLEVGTPAAPITHANPSTITFSDTPTDLTTDPEQYFPGLVSFGNLLVQGEVKTSFARVEAEPAGGSAKLAFPYPVQGWLPGDVVVIPDTHQLNQVEATVWGGYVNQTEEMTIASVSADGMTVFLTGTLANNHYGGHNLDGTLFAGSAIAPPALPHVGNLSRSVVFQSAHAQGTRGHILPTGYGTVRVNYACLKSLGRTLGSAAEDNTTFSSNGSLIHVGNNQYNRVPFGPNGMIGPYPPQGPYQWEIVGCSVWGDDPDRTSSASPFHRWAIATYNAHYGLVQGNFVYRAASAGIGTKFPQDANNTFDSNFVCRCIGDGNRDSNEAEGAGFYFFGTRHIVTNNAAANVTGHAPYSYSYVIGQKQVPASLPVPAYQGADPTVAGQSVVYTPYDTPVLKWENNEGYGATNNYLSFWFLGCAPGGIGPNSKGGGTLLNGSSWNIYQWTIYGYDSYGLTLDGFTYRGTLEKGPNTQYTWGAWTSDYPQTQLTFTNWDVEGCTRGVTLPYYSHPGNPLTLTVSDSTFVCGIGVVAAPVNQITGQHHPVEAHLDNVTCQPLPGKPLVSIEMLYQTTQLVGPVNLVESNKVFVTAHNGVQGDDFQVFWTQQAPGFVGPVSGNPPGLVAFPVAGLTNTQALTQYGICMFGSITQSTVTRPDIQNGYVG
jgi:hypothetical protein